MNGTMEITKCIISDTNSLLLEYDEYYEISYLSDTYKRILKLYKNELVKKYSYINRCEIIWYRCYKRRPNDEKDGYVEVSEKEFKMLETKFIMLTRLEKIERIKCRTT